MPQSLIFILSTMYNGKKVHAVIPARAGSKRLERKNVRMLLGKPMLAHAIEACKKTKYIDEVYVSTEDPTIAEIAKEYGAKVIDRPEELAQDKVPTQAVMKHFADVNKEFDIMVDVQANSPQVKPENIDKAIAMLEDKKLWEVRCVNSEGLEHGAFRTATREVVYWNGLSAHFGVVVDEAIDVHSEEDLKHVEEAMKNGNLS